MRNSQKGFTLAELLIVVAIIAVLTAIAIPIFWPKLERSREETDIANLYSAKAAAAAAIMDDSFPDGTVYFDASKGVLTTTCPVGYGKGTDYNGRCEPFDMGGTVANYYTSAYTAKGQVILVEREGQLTVKLSWVDPT